MLGAMPPDPGCPSTSAQRRQRPPAEGCPARAGFADLGPGTTPGGADRWRSVRVRGPLPYRTLGIARIVERSERSERRPWPSAALAL